MRRLLCAGLASGAFILGSIGCASHRGLLRSKDGDAGAAPKPGAADSDTTKVIGGDSDSKNPQSLFKADRRTGGWSSTAREIERDLGVN
jgi:hypothetical protein